MTLRWLLTPNPSFIQVFLPSFIVAFSVLWIAASLVYRQLAKRRSWKYHPLPTHRSAFSADDDSSTEADDDEFAQHLSLRHTVSHGTFTEVKVVRPRGEAVLVVLEGLAILGMLGTFTAEIVLRHGDVWNIAGMPIVAGVACWVSPKQLGSLRGGLLTRDRAMFSCLGLFDCVFPGARMGRVCGTTQLYSTCSTFSSPLSRSGLR